MIELTKYQHQLFYTIFQAWKLQINKTKYYGPPLELELRFSTFPPEEHNKSFKPRINVALFHSILTQMENITTNSNNPSQPNTKPMMIQRTETRDVTYIYKHCDNGMTTHPPIRKTVNEITGQTTWMQKQHKNILDIPQYNVRLSLSSEQPLNSNNAIVDINSYQLSYIRNRVRISFITPICKYDFTLVRTNTSDKNNRDICELEIEFNPERAEMCDIVNEMKKMLCLLQNTYSRPVSFNETKYILSYYYSLIGGTFGFVGAHPETIRRVHLQNNNMTLYYGTQKYDGERGLVIVDNRCQIYIIDRKLQVKYVGWTSSNAAGTLMDAEIVNNNIYIFDILIDRGTDLRENRIFNLPKRLDVLNSVKFDPPQPLITTTESTTTTYKISLKPYFSIPCSDDDINATQSPEPTDGLIFTPCDEPYPRKVKWPTLLKWKPEQLNTIDFMLLKRETKMKNDDTYVYELHVATNNPAETNHFHNQCLDMDCSAINVDGQIGECNYCPQTQKFSLVKIRLDKSKPNHISVANQIFTTIQEPVTIKDLSNAVVRSSVNNNKTITIIDGYNLISDIRSGVDYVSLQEKNSTFMPIQCLRKSFQKALILSNNQHQQHQEVVQLTFPDVLLLDIVQKGFVVSDEQQHVQLSPWHRCFTVVKLNNNTNLVDCKKEDSEICVIDKNVIKLLAFKKIDDLLKFIGWITGNPTFPQCEQEQNRDDDELFYSNLCEHFGISIILYNKDCQWIEKLISDSSHTLIMLEFNDESSKQQHYICIDEKDNSVDFSNKEYRQMIQDAITQKFPASVKTIEEEDDIETETEKTTRKRKNENNEEEEDKEKRDEEEENGDADNKMIIKRRRRSINTVLSQILPLMPISALKIYATEILNTELPTTMRKKQDIIDFISSKSSLSFLSSS